MEVQYLNESKNKKEEVKITEPLISKLFRGKYQIEKILKDQIYPKNYELP